MTDEEREIALYCLKASSDYHSEVCDECVKHPNCDHTIQDDVTETIIKALKQQSITWIVGKDNCQVAVRNMPIDKMQKICAIIEEEEQQPCEDCISREDAIKQCGFGMTSLLIADCLRKLPSVTPNARWIPVSEPPKETGEYLTTIKWHDRENVYKYMVVKRDYFAEVDTWNDSFVIAWMPLPQPYKESEE